MFTELIARLNLPITPTKAFEVSLGTGETLQGEGECKKLWLHLEGMMCWRTSFLFLWGIRTSGYNGSKTLEQCRQIGRLGLSEIPSGFGGDHLAGARGTPPFEAQEYPSKAMVHTLRKAEGGILVEPKKIKENTDMEHKEEEVTWPL